MPLGLAVKKLFIFRVALYHPPESTSERDEADGDIASNGGGHQKVYVGCRSD